MDKNSLNTLLDSVQETLTKADLEFSDELLETEVETSEEVGTEEPVTEVDNLDFMKKFTENYIERMEKESFYLKEAFYQIKYENPVLNNFGKSGSKTVETTTIDKYTEYLVKSFPKNVGVEVYRSPAEYELAQLIHLRDIKKSANEKQLLRITELQDVVLPEERIELQKHFDTTRESILKMFAPKEDEVSEEEPVIEETTDVVSEPAE